MPSEKGDIHLIVAPEENSMRFDAMLACRIDDLSRSQAAVLIRRGDFRVEGQVCKPSHRLRRGEQITGQIPEPEPLDLVPEPIPLKIFFEDNAVIVIDKPAGLVVHPAAGHASGTLVNALLHHCPDLGGIGGERRPGIVHRLDKDTSGLMVVAKNAHAHHELSCQFKNRQVHKEYLAIVHGVPEKDCGTIDLSIGRHRTDRKKMSVTGHAGREAITEWTVQERLPASALLKVKLKTGRTHQIRVHCLSMGCPLVGDPVYCRRRQLQPLMKRFPALYKVLQMPERQMLHSARLRFRHPIDGTHLSFESELPEDMASLLQELRALNLSA